MTVLVFLDPAYPAGRVADASKPQLMATDLGATRGDGVFESMLAVDGHARKVDMHLERMASSAAALQLDFPAPQVWETAIATALAEFARLHGDVPAVVKLMLTRGPGGRRDPDGVGRRLPRSGVDRPRSAKKAWTCCCWTAATTPPWQSVLHGCCWAPRRCPTP